MHARLMYLVKGVCLITMVVMSGCASDRLITRKNHNHDMQYCWQRIADANKDPFALTSHLERDIQHFQLLMEEGLVQREQAVKLIDEINNDVQHNIPIPPGLLEKLNVGMHRGLDLTDRVVSHIAANECWLLATKSRLSSNGLEPIDPYTRYKGFLMAFSATLTLYDTYYTTAYILNQNGRVRQFLNQSDHGYGRDINQLQAVTDTIFNTENILLVKREIKFYEDNLKDYLSRIEKEEDASYLNTLIKQSPTYGIIRDASLEDIQAQQEIIASAELEDGVLELGRQTVNEISKLFGNLIGLIEERKGKLYRDRNSLRHIKKALKAGDILLEKTPFRLTDKMIPGHWGHAAIWIGTRDELEVLGIWEHPVVEKYHSQILKKQSVVEALRSGVEMNSLAHFMNIDDIAIVRDPDKTDSETAERIIRTLRQVGKEYDFNYNVETTDKIVCSQLVYLAYTDITWPTEMVIGRHTISPDNIANKAINSGPLKLVMLYHDGNHIDDQPVHLMQRLMLSE